MSAFGILVLPSEDLNVTVLFANQIYSDVSKSVNGVIEPLKVRGRKRRYERHQIEIYRGDTESILVQVTHKDKPLPLNLFEVKATIRLEPENEIIHEQTITNGLYGSNFAKGQVVFVIPSEITRILPIKSLFDIQAEHTFTNSDNEEVTHTNTLCSGLLRRVDDLTY